MQTLGLRNIWVRRLLTLVVPLLFVIVQPLGMTLRQSLVAGALVLTIMWWSTGLVSKIPSCLFLLGIFVLFSSAPVQTVFSFPLSETFILIVLTYLFSRGIENSGLTGRVLEPLLFRFVKTPAHALISVFLAMVATIYIIPQPLARLIVVADIYRSFLKMTTVSSKASSVILFSVFNFYVAVNMMSVDADIILNTAAISFSQVDITNQQWMAYMALPTLLFSILLVGLLLFVFRKELAGTVIQPKEVPQAKGPLTRREQLVAAVVACTIALWAAGGLLGGMLPVAINPTVVTLIATVLLFGLGTLKLKDLRSIDVTTLVFLTAAFSIGGAMKASGIAEIVFARVAKMFPSQYSLGYVAMLVVITMGMHVILGSNTTTASVVLPGFVMISGGILSPTAVLLICHTSLASHYILPFHSVSMMIGSSNEYFPPAYVPKMGAVLTAVIFAMIFLVYLPWWKFMGLI